MALLDRAIVRLLPAVPRPVVRRLSERYIAGATLDDARRVVAELNGEGKRATVDVLGEEIASPGEARAIAAAYLDVLDAIDADGLDSNVSVKLTALGLGLDYELAKENVRAVAARGTFVRIDMEDSSTTDDTLRLYRELRAEGLQNLGVVLQSSLRRTVDDARALAAERANVRLCKGIYVEPPAIQFRDDAEVRESFLEALGILLHGGSYVGIATHDDVLLEESKRLVEGREGFEFQMLLGVRRELGDALVAGGYALRIYVPFGSHWYEYSLRRLQENPKIAGYVAADTLSRLVPR